MSGTETPHPTEQLTARLPILCLVTDVGVAGGDTQRAADIVAEAVDGGVNMVQVRAPGMADDEYHDFIGLVSDSVDCAALVVANIGGRDGFPSVETVNGFHLPESAIFNIPLLLRDAPAWTLVGASAHSVSSARAAVSEGAHYVILGTVFPTASHPGRASQGLPLIKAASTKLEVPVLGIGGITTDTAAAVIRSGASGVAVIRAVASAPDPSQAASELYQVIQSAWSDSRES